MLQGKIIRASEYESVLLIFNFVLKGDPILKAKIQHIAASEAGRDLHYHPFHDPLLKEKVERNKLTCSTVGRCYHELMNYAEQRIGEIVLEANLRSTTYSSGHSSSKI
jgi:Poly (ADP-ribose) glycohydrolase (PARG)